MTTAVGRDTATPARGYRHPSLMRHLLLWSLGALAVVWASFMWLGYQTGVHEADELTDGHLASVAALLVRAHALALDVGAEGGVPPMRSASHLRAHDYQQSLSVVVWDRSGMVVGRSGMAPLPSFSTDEGFADVRTGWRGFSLWDRDRERKVMVMVDVRERDALARDIAEQVVEPGLWLLPVVALALGLALRRGLRPLFALSQDVEALPDAPGQRLPPTHGWRELEPVVASINTLLERQAQALARERQLAHEVAHELRTPLSSIALHARALESEDDESARARALMRIREDALRGGHVLNQLLCLARTTQMPLHEPPVALDVAALARTVAAEYGQQAWQRDDVLSVEAPQRLMAQGHPVLLEMALRNLVENALKHTPRGTSVAIQVGQLPPDTVWIAVSDDGRRSDVVPEPDAKPVDSLHLGHAIVQRVARAHGGQFGSAQAHAPYTTCFRLAWRFGAVQTGE